MATQNPCPTGNYVTGQQDPASAVAGHIGIARAKVLVWDHDPFHARPMQQLTWRMTPNATKEMDIEPEGVIFQLNGAFLEPIFEPHDTFIGTFNPKGPDKFINPGTKEAVDIESNIDLLGSSSFSDIEGTQSSGSDTGANAHTRLPGGLVYEFDFDNCDDPAIVLDLNAFSICLYKHSVGKNIFPHQLWLHRGSMLKYGVILHPSEYNEDIGNIAMRKDIQRRRVQEEIEKFSLEEVMNAPMWQYVEIVEEGKKVYWPQMISKQIADLQTPVHWTIEKYTPTFQGEDFFVNIKLGDKQPDTSVDQNPDHEVVDTIGWNGHYKPLMFNPDSPPAGWVPGITNEAYSLPLKQGEGGSLNTEREKEARKKFWWGPKSYILIEIGAGHGFHNYFIELVKGRFPRFIHMGEEWDHPDRLTLGVDGLSGLDREKFQYMRKARVMTGGVYKKISVDQLFEQKDIRIYVRHHLGKLVITFKGYESFPWVIARQDNDPDRKPPTDFTKFNVPIMVPPFHMRIHGGNISASVGFAPTKYTSDAIIPYFNRQADTGLAKNKDVYMTFSHMGANLKYEKKRFTRKFFRDDRFGFIKVGYACDAYDVREYNRNVRTTMELGGSQGLYGVYNEQYRLYGKGWIFDRKRNTDGDLFERDDKEGLPEPHKLWSGLTKNRDLQIEGIPHLLEIVNLRTPTTPFKFGIKEDAGKSFPYKDYASKWDVGVRLAAGTVEMPKLSRKTISDRGRTDLGYAIDKTAKKARFVDTVTPIVDQWRMVVLGGGKPIADNISSFDISSLVMNIQDSWSDEQFTTINHEMQMKCYIPQGVPIAGSDEESENIHALGQKLLKLHNKSFHLTVSYWWENGVGERDASGNKLPRTGFPEDSPLLIQMTGRAEGAELEKSVNKVFMNFTIKDYMSVLEEGFIFNSPFFDAVQDTLAVYELAKLAGFDSSRRVSRFIDRRPLGFLQKVLENTKKKPDAKFLYNGEVSRNRIYDLPGSFADIANPKMRFQNGESYAAAIKKLAAVAGKTVYFDRWGVLKFENSPAFEAAFESKDARTNFVPVFDFVSTPFQDGGLTEDPDVEDKRFVFDPTKHAAHLVYNTLTYTRSVADAINQIVLLSASNDIFGDGTNQGGLIVEGITFFEQIWNPEAEGFFGFRKPFYQSDGVFGDLAGVRAGVAHYAKMKYPPADVSFQTYGVPGLKALDIITLDDNLFYITQITHEIDPSNNNWWMNVQGEWLKPFLGDLGILDEKGEQDSGP